MSAIASKESFSIQLRNSTHPDDNIFCKISLETRPRGVFSHALQHLINTAKSIATFAGHVLAAPFVLLANVTACFISGAIILTEIAALSLASLPLLIITGPFLAMLTVASIITGMTLAMIFIPPLLIISALNGCL